MFMKKGQSALEFLTTYGWAFLVALIMIGALAYFGVLNPSKYLPERCTFGSGVTCNDYFIKETNGALPEVSLSLANSLGETVIVTDVVLNTSTPNSPGCSVVAIPDATSPWKDGATYDFEFQCSTMTNAGIVTGSKSKINVKITYYAAKSSSTYSHDLMGEVYAQVS